MKRLAVVVQRYGEDVTGGAEHHARWAVQHLKDRFDITVFSTTADDYITWNGSYKPGEDELDGVPVLRYPVEESRDIDRFNDYSKWILHEQHRDCDEERWLRMQGPYCPELIEAVKTKRNSFDLFFFFTYLYYTTVKGIQQVGDRAVILPQVHDEPAVRLRLYKPVFDAPRGFLLNTNVEMQLIESLFNIGYRPRIIVGMGIEWPEPAPDPVPTLEKYGLDRPFAFSSGRISAGKGHDLILECLPDLDDDFDIVFFGKQLIDFPDDPRIRFLGFVSEEEKWHLARAATFSIQPSRYESLSLTLLESWSMGTPALVNGQCAVLADHIDSCGGGYAYKSAAEFVKQFNTLAGNPELRDELSLKGREYVRRYYENEKVVLRYAGFLERMIELRSK
jgi:glycosyltransferase involved in cell wall biosynthesis